MTGNKTKSKSTDFVTSTFKLRIGIRSFINKKIKIDKVPESFF